MQTPGKKTKIIFQRLGPIPACLADKNIPLADLIF